jgi:4'-phosphopantetheinyl transferase
VTLPPGDIHVWLAFDGEPMRPELLRGFMAMLEPGEIERMNRLRDGPLRNQFLVTRALQRSVLADYLQADPRELRFAAGAHGKPALAAPFDRAGLFFNVAHTRGLVAVAVSGSATLGVDVENIEARTAPLAVAARYFAACEADALRALPPAGQQRRFYALWTLKESWLKATGRGLAAGMANVCFEFDEQHNATGVTLQRQPADHWLFWQARPTAAHELALALRLEPGSGGAAEPVVRLRGWPEANARQFPAPRRLASAAALGFR